MPSVTVVFLIDTVDYRNIRVIYRNVTAVFLIDTVIYRNITAVFPAHEVNHRIHTVAFPIDTVIYPIGEMIFPIDAVMYLTREPIHPVGTEPAAAFLTSLPDGIQCSRSIAIKKGNARNMEKRITVFRIVKRFRIAMGGAIIAIVLSSCLSTGTGYGWSGAGESFTVSHHATVCGFENPSFGITGGLVGETHYTRDGGRTWPTGEKAGVSCRLGLDIVDSNVAVSAGENGISVSHDGGASWQKLTYRQFDLVSFVDPHTGWIARGREICSTRDGGKTWNDVKMPDGCGDVVSLSLCSHRDGCFLDDSGMLYLSDSAAETWIGRPVTVDNDEYGFVWRVSAMRFVSPREGSIVAYARRHNRFGWVELETKDGGTTWTLVPIGNSFERSYLGNPYLSRSRNLLTVCDAATNTVTMYRKNP